MTETDYFSSYFINEGKVKDVTHSHFFELREVSLWAVLVEILLEAPNLGPRHTQRLQVLVRHKLDLAHILHLQEEVRDGGMSECVWRLVFSTSQANSSNHRKMKSTRIHSYTSAQIYIPCMSDLNIFFYILFKSLFSK